MRHFLNDLLKHGSYTGFPTLGIETQTMENAHLREAFGMAPKQKAPCQMPPALERGAGLTRLLVWLGWSRSPLKDSYQLGS